MLPLFDNVPVRRSPVVTYALIAANLAVCLWELGARGSRVDHYAFYPCAVSGPCRGPAIDHLAWPEGALTGDVPARELGAPAREHALPLDLREQRRGRDGPRPLPRLLPRRRLRRGARAGGVTLHYAGDDAASVPTVGASGAIAGVLGAYLVLLPHARVVTLLFGFLPVPLSAMFFLGFWFVFQLWQGGFSLTQPDAGGGVAFAAHVGGFLFGVLAVRLFQVRAPLRPRW